MTSVPDALARAEERARDTRSEEAEARIADERAALERKAAKALRTLRVSAHAFACLPFDGADWFALVAARLEQMGAMWLDRHGTTVRRPRRPRRRKALPAQAPAALPGPLRGEALSQMLIPYPP